MKISEFSTIHNPNERGQASIEFALTLVLGVSFFFFFFQFCMTFAFGNWVHYATFMSARAYLSSGPSLQDQRVRATQVLTSLVKRSSSTPNLDRFPLFGKGIGGGGEVTGMSFDHPNFQPNERSASWLRGVRYQFQVRLFLWPFQQSSNLVFPLSLTSESWLGKEPSVEECLTDLSQRGSKYFDNGC